MNGEAGNVLRVDLRARPAPGSDFLVDVAFEAPPGITILFGPSGAGKSTILSAIAGLLPLERGRIAIDDQVWYDAAARVNVPAHRRRIGLVFQSLALFPHMTALENVLYGLPRPGPGGEAGRRARAVALLERMRVPHLAGRRPVTFSGGEGQRVALARAFAVAPRVLLLDEAFSAMDERLRGELYRDVRSFISETRIPVIQITHQRDEARSIGDRLIVVDGGQVRAQGSIALLAPEAGSPLAPAL